MVAKKEVKGNDTISISNEKDETFLFIGADKKIAAIQRTSLDENTANNNVYTW